MKHIIRGAAREDEITLEWWLEYTCDGVILKCSRYGTDTEWNILCIMDGHLVRSRGVPESLGLDLDSFSRVEEAQHESKGVL